MSAVLYVKTPTRSAGYGTCAVGGASATKQLLAERIIHLSRAPPPPRFAWSPSHASRGRISKIVLAAHSASEVCIPPQQRTLLGSPPAHKEGRGAPRGASNQCPRHTGKRHRLPMRGARGAEARRKSGRARLPALHCGTRQGFDPLGSASGRASWNYRVQTGGPSPAPVQRAPRGPVVVPAGTMPEAARVRGYEPRPREPLSLRRRYVTGDAPRLSEIKPCITTSDGCQALRPRLSA